MLNTVILVVCSLAAVAFGQTPTVTIRSSDPASTYDGYIQAYRDQDVIMDCYVENLPAETTVRWQRTYLDKNGNWSTLSLSQDMALEDNIHYSIERPTQFTWRLRVRAVQVSDEGTYMCFVLTTLNSRAKDIRIISVVFSPILDPQQTSSDTSATQGDEVDLSCNATGRPSPAIQWSRLGGALLPIGQEKYLGVLLTINSIRAEDRGIYRCTAYNDVGSVINDVNVDVRFAPIITAPRTVIYQAVGYRVELQCYGEGNPTPTVDSSSWLMGATTYTTSSDGYDVNFIQGAFGRTSYELVIFNVQPSSYGTYTCRMKNSIATTSYQIQLMQTNIPQKSVKTGVVIAGSSLTAAVNTLPLLVSTLVTLLICLARIFD